ncbi:MAG: glycosyltransferase family 4 protein [Candidatus Scalindua sp.]|jgi:glycosyltransferase involved in cell wall biosynthesis|nr:glycosyltransferase family 4 protein [Candidatus Scalindua sp.]
MNIEYICFGSLNGYAIAAKNYILALRNHNLRIHTLDSQHRIDVAGDNLNLFKKFAKKEENPEAIQIYHCIPPMQRRRRKNKLTIGVATFETHNPPRHWIKILNQNDAVIVPSTFCEEIFKKAGITSPIYLIPHTLDLNKYNTDIAPKETNSKFRFLFIGAWRKRKGYEELIKAWCSMFSNNEQTELVIKTDRPNRAENYVRKLTNNILIEPRTINESNMPSFIKSFDCLVLPTKGEGFGLPVLQAMALGVPVIVTDYSGCTDFANNDTAFLLKPEGIVVKEDMDSIPQFMNRKWAEISIDQISEVMKFVYDHPEEVKQKVWHAEQFVRRGFGLDLVARQFDQLFSIL